MDTASQSVDDRENKPLHHISVEEEQQEPHLKNARSRSSMEDHKEGLMLLCKAPLGHRQF
jgi:hypothetical protein